MVPTVSFHKWHVVSEFTPECVFLIRLPSHSRLTRNARDFESEMCWSSCMALIIFDTRHPADSRSIEYGFQYLAFCVALFYPGMLHEVCISVPTSEHCHKLKSLIHYRIVTVSQAHMLVRNLSQLYLATVPPTRLHSPFLRPPRNLQPTRYTSLVLSPHLALSSSLALFACPHTVSSTAKSGMYSTLLCVCPFLELKVISFASSYSQCARLYCFECEKLADEQRRVRCG